MTDIKRAQDQLFDRKQSAREKYASLVVGRPGWGALLKHELVSLLAQPEELPTTASASSGSTRARLTAANSAD